MEFINLVLSFFLLILVMILNLENERFINIFKNNFIVSKINERNEKIMTKIDWHLKKEEISQERK